MFEILVIGLLAMITICLLKIAVVLDDVHDRLNHQIKTHIPAPPQARDPRADFVTREMGK